MLLTPVAQSGFFTAMLRRNRGLRELGKHRVKRILLPMVLGVIVFVPMINNVGRLEELKKANSIWDAAKKGDTESIRQYLAKGVDVNGKDDKQATSLHWAAVYGQTEATELLIEQGADVNGKDGAGSSPLHWAAFLGRYADVEIVAHWTLACRPLRTQGAKPIVTRALVEAGRVARMCVRLRG